MKSFCLFVTEIFIYLVLREAAKKNKKIKGPTPKALNGIFFRALKKLLSGPGFTHLSGPTTKKITFFRLPKAVRFSFFICTYKISFFLGPLFEDVYSVGYTVDI